jgi:hypothetical protein
MKFSEKTAAIIVGRGLTPPMRVRGCEKRRAASCG